MSTRRDFITLLGGAVAVWPLAAHAQQNAIPVIGFLEIRSPESIAERLRAFRQGLKETGYVEGENIAIDYRWAEQMERLPELAAQLVRRQVAVIVTAGGIATTLAAKEATTTIPIVFAVSDDPVKHGLVASLARPGGNLTGFNILSTELTAKRLELLREMLPRASRITVLVNPASVYTQTTVREVEAAGRAIGFQTQIVNVTRCSVRVIDLCLGSRLQGNGVSTANLRKNSEREGYLRSRVISLCSGNADRAPAKSRLLAVEELSD